MDTVIDPTDEWDFYTYEQVEARGQVALGAILDGFALGVIWITGIGLGPVALLVLSTALLIVGLRRIDL